jgi:octaprenyl-diphosphate synthase
MSQLDLIKTPILEEMKSFETQFKSSMKSKIPLLNIIIDFIYRNKGKQMRPMFVFLSAKMNGTINPSTFIAASMIEMLHTATLVHDDVVDESFERRGLFSINALWKSKMAVLLGDYLLAQGLLLSVKNKEYDLLDIVSEAVKQTMEGEILQMKYSRGLNINEVKYFEIISKKTAALIGSCTACGAKSVGLSAEQVALMKEFGTLTGIAFQIKDDLLDYKKNGLIGKPTGNDIKEKKLTLPLIYAIEKSSPSNKKQIINTIKNHNKNQKRVNEVIDYVIKSGGIEFSEEKMKEYRDKAINILNNFPDNDSKNSLIELVNYTTDRTK